QTALSRTIGTRGAGTQTGREEGPVHSAGSGSAGGAAALLETGDASPDAVAGTPGHGAAPAPRPRPKSACCSVQSNDPPGLLTHPHAVIDSGDDQPIPRSFL